MSPSDKQVVARVLREYADRVVSINIEDLWGKEYDEAQDRLNEARRVLELATLIEKGK